MNISNKWEKKTNHDFLKRINKFLRFGLLILSSLQELNKMSEKRSRQRSLLSEGGKQSVTLLEKETNFKGGFKRLGWFIIIGGLEGLLSIFLPAILYYFEKPYNLSEIWISTLGVDGGYIGLIFNIGLIISAFGLFSLGYILFKLTWNHSNYVKNIIKFSLPVALITSIGIIILCIWNMEANIAIHSVGAYMFFVGSAIIFGLYTGILKLVGLIGKKHFLVKFTGIYILIYIANIPISAINSASNNIAFADMLGSMDPGLGITRIFEWVLIILFFGWLLLAGIMFLKFSKRASIEVE